MVSNAIFKKIICLLIVFGAIILKAEAQTSTFTYQGKLTENSAPANGTYLMRFQLYDAQFNGTQVGAALTDVSVVVTNGIFTTQLDFGAGVFDGSPRFLQVSVRHNTSESYLALAPRQPLTSAPYAVKSINAETADLATQSNDSSNLGGVAASQYVQTSDTRLSDSRNPTQGSSFYIQNSGATTQSANFNISGDGTAGGTLTGTVVNAATQFQIGGNRFLSGNPALLTLFAGFNSGASNTTGMNNVFLGGNAGFKNTSGSGNTFVGKESGFNTTTSNGNSFFGGLSGFFNQTGTGNAFFGSNAGFKSTADANSFFGESSGLNTTTGGGNSFFGEKSGFNNSSGAFNSFFGIGAGFSNTTADRNSFFGVDSGRLNQTGAGNSFFGESSGYNNIANNNSFFGSRAGFANTTGTSNTFVGFNAGIANTVADDNTFVGFLAGNTAGANINAAGNAFFGSRAGQLTTAGANSFFGAFAGSSTTGSNSSENSFFGYRSGIANTTGAGNTFVGSFSGQNNTTGSDNTLLGVNTKVPSNVSLTNATAIGANATVDQSNALILGSINGVNGATADTRVGIGTTAPTTKLEIRNGNVYLNNTSPTVEGGIILRSANGACWILLVGNSGNLGVANIVCP